MSRGDTALTDLSEAEMGLLVGDTRPFCGAVDRFPFSRIKVVVSATR